MDKEILKHYFEEGKKFGYALARGATDLPSVQTFDELYTEQLNKPLVMQGCQCKDRIGETKVWCCNQCGLPCQDFWLPTHYTVGSRTVASEGSDKNA